MLGTILFKAIHFPNSGVNMPRTTLKLKPCAVTMGKPFDTDGNRLCPVYVKMKKVLEARGWEQKSFYASKVPQGDVCYFKFEGIEKVQENGGNVGILFSANVNIEGLNKTSGSTCIVNLTLESYNPENKITTINHSSESEIINFLEEQLRA